MVERKLLSVLCLGALQASASSDEWCGHSLLDDATCLYQRQLRAQQEAAHGGPKIDLKNLDPSDLGRMIPRQMTPAEIEGQVLAMRNLTVSVKSTRDLTEQATSPLSSDPMPGELNQMVQKLTTAITSVRGVVDLHLQALDYTFDTIKQNSPPMMAMATAKGEEGLKLPVRDIINAAGRVNVKLNNISSPSDLCNQASSFLSEVRTHSRRYAKACDMVLYMLPPPMPPDNPWVNSTLVEATRSMYTLSKASTQDADDSLEAGISTFLRNGAGCELDIVDSGEAEELASLPEEGMAQQQKGGALALRYSAIVVAVAGISLIIG